MEDSPGRLAHLTRGWFAGEATAADRARRGSRLARARQRSSPSALCRPSRALRGRAACRLDTASRARSHGWRQCLAGPAGSVFVVSAAPSPREVAQGTRPVAAALSESLSALGDSERVTPMADERDLGASALLRRGDALLLVLHLRAPGDSALCAVVLSLARNGRPVTRARCRHAARVPSLHRGRMACWRDVQAAEALRRGRRHHAPRRRARPCACAPRGPGGARGPSVRSTNRGRRRLPRPAARATGQSSCAPSPRSAARSHRRRLLWLSPLSAAQPCSRCGLRRASATAQAEPL